MSNAGNPSQSSMCVAVGLGEHQASKVRMSDGWSFVAHGLQQYEDGSVERNFSTGGAFRQAVRWDMVPKDPFDDVLLPKKEKKIRDIWTVDVIRQALANCSEGKLFIAINLAFACSLRLGEITGLTWDEERKINAQKFEISFYANPDMRQVERDLNPPKPEQGTDLQKLVTQLQENPELASQLKAILYAK